MKNKIIYPRVVLLLIAFVLLLSFVDCSSSTILSGRGKRIEKQYEEILFEVIVKGKCENYKEELIKTIQISKHTNGGCFPISLIDSSKDFNDSSARFSCVNLDQQKSLFKVHQPTPKKQYKRYQDENEDSSSKKQDYVVSWVLQNSFIESTKTFTYLKRPTCKSKKDLCSSKEFIDYCNENKVIPMNGFISTQGKERIYLIPPNLKVSSCFVGYGGCCPYISSFTSGICGGERKPLQNECRNKKCDDENVCTIDKCNSENGLCEFTPIKCDDENECTKDSCHPEMGCLFNAVNCDDGDACTIDTCDEKKGCLRTTIDCDDKNNCTVDSCDKSTGKCENIRKQTPECSIFFANPVDKDCENPLTVYSSTCDKSLTFDPTTGSCYAALDFASLDKRSEQVLGQVIPNVVLKSFTFVVWIYDAKITPTSVDWAITIGCVSNETPKCKGIGVTPTCPYLKEINVAGSTYHLYSCTVKVDPSCDLTSGGPYYLNLYNGIAEENSVFIDALKYKTGCGCELNTEGVFSNYLTYSLKIN